VISPYDDKEIMVMYRHTDGYPEGHGVELAKFLKGMIIVNGIRLNDERRIANGMGCLAAQMVTHFKVRALLDDGVSGIYLHPSGTRDIGEEYIYKVSIDKKDKEKRMGIEESEDRKVVITKDDEYGLIIEITSIYEPGAIIGNYEPRVIFRGSPEDLILTYKEGV